MKDISVVLTMARHQAGLTQKEQGELAGMSQPAVARLERGRGSPTLDTVSRLLAAAGFELRFELLPTMPYRDAVVEAYKAGVDRSLLRDNLRKSVDQRLRDIDAFRRDAEALRGAVRRGNRNS